MATAKPTLVPGLYANNVGFNTLSYSNMWLSTGCGGKSTLNWDRRIFTNVYWLPCSQFTTEASCNSFENCNFTTGWFNFTQCSGVIKGDFDYIHQDINIYKVNLSAYGFPESPVNDSPNKDFYTIAMGDGFCDSKDLPFLNNAYTCEQWGCIWSNISQGMSGNKIITYDTKGISIGGANNVLTIWDTIKFITTFNFDIGWGDFNWIISAVFYIFNIFLIAGIYFTFVPF